MKAKKLIGGFLAISLLAAGLAGCSEDKEKPAKPAKTTQEAPKEKDKKYITVTEQNKDLLDYLAAANDEVVYLNQNFYKSNEYLAQFLDKKLSYKKYQAKGAEANKDLRVHLDKVKAIPTKGSAVEIQKEFVTLTESGIDALDGILESVKSDGTVDNKKYQPAEKAAQKYFKELEAFNNKIEKLVEGK
ncbi:hypothetical protein JK635_07645 [Neobacillus sp. YIM B02564]|uniref:Lipoprotein n=1 Tax=Neobacillus paridis TaxID=2803862 RepID=A0ABS1TLE4_9BACI|nr:hypothetical protein [Neobacillus paridis]MBL4952082.1 hypothetical protein [Neobacillus paridis]